MSFRLRAFRGNGMKWKGNEGAAVTGGEADCPLLTR